ncbi:MAG: type II toxin-antitoxin system VapC family toxin [Candidatus Bathyarchaeia archaeon]
MGRIISTETKPLALVDSNILIYALNIDYSDQKCHEKCLELLEKGLKRQLNYTLALNPIVTVEVFAALRKILGCNVAESRISNLLQSRRLGYISISREACQIGVKWAKEHNIPVNDALIAASAAESAPTIYTTDEHFKKLQTHKLTIINPATANPLSDESVKT